MGVIAVRDVDGTGVVQIVRHGEVAEVAGAMGTVLLPWQRLKAAVVGLTTGSEVVTLTGSGPAPASSAALEGDDGNEE